MSATEGHKNEGCWRFQKSCPRCDWLARHVYYDHKV